MKTLQYVDYFINNP